MKYIRSASPANIAAAKCLFEIRREFIVEFRQLFLDFTIITFLSPQPARNGCRKAAIARASEPCRPADFRVLLAALLELIVCMTLGQPHGRPPPTPQHERSRTHDRSKIAKYRLSAGSSRIVLPSYRAPGSAVPPACFRRRRKER